MSDQHRHDAEDPKHPKRKRMRRREKRDEEEKEKNREDDRRRQHYKIAGHSKRKSDLRFTLKDSKRKNQSKK